jgi:hypothetical protein
MEMPKSEGKGTNVKSFSVVAATRITASGTTRGSVFGSAQRKQLAFVRS